MSHFYFCKKCNLLIAGEYAKKLHRDNGHTVTDVSDGIPFGVTRDPSACTSSTNSPVKISVENIYKVPIYIGKSGHEIATRREGSYVSVKYVHIAPVSGVQTPVSEQEYYKLLFENGIPPEEKLHTFSSKARNCSNFARFILRSKQKHAITTKDPSDDSAILFAQKYLYDADSAALWSGEEHFSMYLRQENQTNASGEQRKYFSALRYSAKILYYDLLSPREDSHGIKRLTRVLMTCEYRDDLVDNKVAPKSRRFVLYELDENEEAQQLEYSTSPDWAARIVQDARSILCS